MGLPEIRPDSDLVWFPFRGRLVESWGSSVSEGIDGKPLSDGLDAIEGFRWSKYTRFTPLESTELYPFNCYIKFKVQVI